MTLYYEHKEGMVILELLVWFPEIQTAVNRMSKGQKCLSGKLQIKEQHKVTKSPRLRFFLPEAGALIILFTGRTPIRAERFPPHGYGCCFYGAPTPFGQLL